VADDRRVSRLVEDHTSGTTGTPLRVWFGRDALVAWYALFEARARVWHGVSRRDRMAMLGGQQVVTPYRRLPPFWVWNDAMAQLYLSVFHLRTDRSRDYAVAMRRRRVAYLLGYPSALAYLARALRDTGVDAPTMRVVITNAEPIRAPEREMISGVFGAPVRATYGMAEVVAAAGECEQATMHDWPEVGILECIPDGLDHPDEPRTSGDLIATGLLNMDMVLVRYAVGDRVTPPAYAACRCGRKLPVIDHVAGRADDLVITRDGRAIGRLDSVFKADLPIQEAQIVQETVDRLRVLVVPARGFDETTRRAIAARTRERVGDVHVDIERVGAIARTANGKFRSVVSRVDRQRLG
jgi:phenylacetate-CoA ligase